MSRIKRLAANVNPIAAAKGEKRCSLSGKWRFRLDPDDLGLAQQWYSRPCSIISPIQVPGTWQGQGFGHAEKENHKEFAVLNRAFTATYCGVGWYEKTFTVPEDFCGKRLWLEFGGAVPTATVWVNGMPVGENKEPLAPFAFEVTDLVHNGENTVTVRISEEDRELCLTYYYCGKWSGLYRDVELTATGESYLDFFSAVPDESGKAFRLTAQIGGDIGGLELQVTAQPTTGGETELCRIPVQSGAAAGLLQLREPKLWSPEEPNLYGMEVLLLKDGEIWDSRYVRSGLVTFQCENKQFKINGQPYYIRGAGGVCEYPETLSPNTSRENWRKCLQTLRDYGYVYYRCQSLVPNPEYYDAADEVGLIVQGEMGTLGPMYGNNYVHTYNQWPKPTPDYRELLRSQWNHVVERDVNHPSAAMYAMSNELKDCSELLYYPNIAWRCYEETKAIKPTALVIWTDGGYREDMPGDFVNDEPDLVEHKTDLPVIQHEYRWWSSFPDISLVEKYDGLPMRPYAELDLLETASARGLTHILPQAARNSQILQYIEAKCKLEHIRRDYPTLAGIQHFSGVDIGMSKQGIVDAFYGKKYADAELWRRTNGDTVLMTSLDFHDRVYGAGDRFRCQLFVSDFAHPAFAAPVLRWQVTDGETVYAQGEQAYTHEPYRTCPAGEVTFNVPQVEQPVSAVLRATLTDGERQAVNEWRLWFFPQAEPLPEGAGREMTDGVRTVVTDWFDAETAAFVKAGGNVILKAGEGLSRPFPAVMLLDKGRYFYTKPASFPPYEELQYGTIIQDHPMLGDFPHEDYGDLQFFNLIGNSPALALEPLGLHEADPVIRMIPSHYTCEQLGYLTERRWGKGRLILCAMDVDNDRPEARYLLQQLCRYTLSEDKPDCPVLSDHALVQVISGGSIPHHQPV